MVLAIRPGTMLQRREFRTLADQMKLTVSLKALQAVSIDEIDQLLAFWEGIPPAPAVPGRVPMIPPPSGVVVRMAKPQDWKKVLNQLMDSPREVRHAGQTYLTANGPDARGWAAFPADDRTLVLAREDLLRELIEDRNSPAPSHPWDETWQKAIKGQMVLALETRWIRRRLAQGLQGGPAGPGQSPASNVQVDTISPLLDKTKSYTLGIDVSEGLFVDLVAAAGADSDAKPVAETLQALATLARNAVQGMRQDLHGRPVAASEALDWAFEASDDLLGKIRIETTGRFVHIQAKSTLDVAGAIKLLTPAVSAAQTASRRVVSINNQKQILLAIHNYTSVNNGHLPTPVLYGGANKSIPYSWRVAILPFIEQNELYKQYNFDEPWDGPNNRRLIDKMPPTYSYPGLAGGTLSRTNTSYFVLSGDAAALGAIAPGKEAAGLTFSDITDGTSNTIMVVEANRETPWTKPEDIPFDPNGPVPDLGGFDPNVFNVGFADGSVRTISKSIAPTVLKALITRDGGEAVSIDAPNAQPTERPRP
jgi:prepilin-type processing-associated H-X9-DG protein